MFNGWIGGFQWFPRFYMIFNIFIVVVVVVFILVVRLFWTTPETKLFKHLTFDIIFISPCEWEEKKTLKKTYFYLGLIGTLASECTERIQLNVFTIAVLVFHWHLRLNHIWRWIWCCWLCGYHAHHSWLAAAHRWRSHWHPLLWNRKFKWRN